MFVVALVTLVVGGESQKPGSVVEIHDRGEADALVGRRFARKATAEDIASAVASEPEEWGAGNSGAPAPTPETLAPADGPEPAPEVAEPEPEGDRIAEVADAIALLEPGNAEHFNKGGKPELSALAEILGYRPTAAERDAAFAKIEG